MGRDMGEMEKGDQLGKARIITDGTDVARQGLM